MFVLFLRRLQYVHLLHLYWSIQNVDFVIGGDDLRETLADYCKRMELENLLAQWDCQQNYPLTPQTISHGSKQKVWWQCAKGHHWQAAVYTRTAGTDCPYCAGKFPLPGETDLATLYPSLAAQWHPTKNAPLTPQQVLPGSHRMVWWQCEKRHEWRAQVKSRVAGCGCPVCANRKIHPNENDLATQYPELAAQWHPTKNGLLDIHTIAPGSRRKAWWRCDKGHVWQATIASRTSGGSGCPVCSGKKVIPGENDLGSQFPELAAQWLTEKNRPLTTRQVTPYSNQKVWWQCELGHKYQAAVAARTMNGSGCPYCAGKKVLAGFNDLAALFPDLAAQWHPTLNGTLTPEMVTAGSHHKVWWECPLGHVWKAVIYSRTGPKHCSCPVCAGKVRTQRRRVSAKEALSKNNTEETWRETK